MVFGNILPGLEIFESYNPDDGTYTPDRTYTLVDSKSGKGLDKIYYYALYKVEFQDESEPEWRLHGQSGPLRDAEGEEYPDYNFEWDADSPFMTISTASDSEGLKEFIPYVATYTTESEGKEGLASAVPVLGCRDKNATNYQYNATMEDGSCIYPTDEGINWLPIALGVGLVGLIALA
mgnify:FL=1